MARERERVAAEREHIAEEREQLAAERERLALGREHLTKRVERRGERLDEREAAVATRERLADERERLADERERSADERERLADAIVRSDIDEIARRTSRDVCVLSIGSDASEWAEGYEQIMRLFVESTPEGELGVRVALDDVKAFREGSVGWAAGHGYFEMEARRVPVRRTAVLHQEDGAWKTVQSHASIGVPNERMLDPMFRGTG